MQSCVIILISLLLGCSFQVYAQNDSSKTQQFPVPKVPFAPKEYVVYQTGDDSIAIDGKLDEAVWQQAKWTTSFVKASGMRKSSPEYTTKVKLLWDENYLYVGAYLEDHHLWGTMTKRDMPLYLDNAFEIFIDPDKDTHNYMELEINALGTIWDLFLTKPYRDGGLGLSDYNLLGYQSAVHLDGKLTEPEPDDKGWSLEYAIPITSILAMDTKRKSLSNGDQWKVNFQRAQRCLKIVDGEYQPARNPQTNKPYPPDFTVWSPQGINNVHYPEMWGLLQFSKTVVGEKEAPFKTNIAQSYRWFLRQLYYKMREYQLNHGYFPKNLQALDIKDSTLTKYQKELTVETTRSLFEVTLPVKEHDQVWHINQYGRVWSD